MMPGLRREIQLREVSAQDAVWVLLRHLGENPDRDGLKDTPARVARAWLEMCSGYKEDPQIHLNTVFEQKDCDQMIVVRDIDFVSHCEHHMVPFHGKAHIGYIPKAGMVVGLSKLARVVDGYARRLQIQERLTAQIAAAIRNKLDPLGVGVILQAEHSCMCIRGVRKAGSSTITTSLHGAMKDEPSCRAEFLNMIK